MPKRYQQRKKDVFVPKRVFHFVDSHGKKYAIDLNDPNNWLDQDFQEANQAGPNVLVPDVDFLQQSQGMSY